MGKQIKIVAVPPGQAPDNVREAWVGLVLPVAEADGDGVQLGALGGEAQNLGGYPVYGMDALKVLARANRKAFEWWLVNVPMAAYNDLVFARDCCEEV